MHFHQNVLCKLCRSTLYLQIMTAWWTWSNSLGGTAQRITTKVPDQHVTTRKASVNTVCCRIPSSSCTCGRLQGITKVENSPTHSMFLLREDQHTKLHNRLTHPLGWWLEAGCSKEVRRRSCSFSTTTWAPANQHNRTTKTETLHGSAQQNQALSGSSRRDGRERKKRKGEKKKEVWKHTWTHARGTQTQWVPAQTRDWRARMSYLDPNITMRSQGRVIQTSRGSFTDPPLEGCCRPQHDVPAKFQ